jgi:hypothetical protein
MVIHPRVRRNLSLAVATAVLVCFGGAGVAQAACAPQPTSKPFAQFGDVANYSLAPGGDFGPGSASWALNGAAVTPVASTRVVNGAPRDQALAVEPNGVAVSPTICVDATNPSLRLFARKLTGGVGRLRVDILYASPINGHAMAATAGYVIQGYNDATGNYLDWAPSPIMRLGTTLPLWKTADGTLPVQLRLSANSDPGAWDVDFVEIDPYRY